MRHTLRAMAALIGYPSLELQKNIGAVRKALLAEGLLSPQAMERLEPLLQAYGRQNLMELQEDYSSLFDSSRSLSLHLFEHVHGDNRERGQAMVDLGKQYGEAGFVMDPAELPDFIPLFLEFLSCLSLEAAREWLNQPAHVLAVLEKRLGERGSNYSAVFHALGTLSLAKPEAEAIAEIEDRPDPANAAELDEAWEDAPVNFGAPTHEGGGPTGIVARIRAARRPAPQMQGRHHA